MLSKGAQNLNSIMEASAIDFLGNPRRRAISSNDDSPNDAIDLQNIAEKRAGTGIMVLNSLRKPVYQDREARELCREINKLYGPEDRETLPAGVLAVCNEVKGQMRRRTHAKDWEQFRVKACYRTFRGRS